MADGFLLPATSAMTGALLILLVFLSVRVTARRAALGHIQFGDAGDEELRHRIRAHGNFIEIAPMMVLAIALMEITDAPAALLWAFAAIFILGRVLHAIRFHLRNPYIGFFSIVSQHVICLSAGAWLLYRFTAVT